MSGKGFLWLAACAGSLSVCLWGCYLDPGSVDAGLVARYQQAMVRRAPQKRAAESGLDSLRPLTNGPPLKVEPGGATGPSHVHLTLDEAVQRTLANSMEVKVVSFDPAIAWEDVARAAAEFDVTAYGSLGYAVQDLRTDSVFGGGHSKTKSASLGLRHKSVTGASLELEAGWQRLWDNQSFRTIPTRHEPSLDFRATQPLLRDGWPEVNLASLNVARLTHRQSLAEFRQKVEEIVSEVIATYWQLVQARLDVEIQQRLLAKTRDTLQRIIARGELDATRVQIKQAESAVESRRAALIRARKSIYDVQDRLARLLADKQINLLSRYDILPDTRPNTEKVKIDATDQLVTALRHNAVLEQARLAIEVAGVAVKVARNQTLPRLDLSASVGVQGQGPEAPEAWQQFNSYDYISYNLGLEFEYPLGNRERRADLRRRRLEKLKAVTNLQDLADQVAVQINERVRQINTAYEEMKAQHTALEAAKAQLDALEAKERRTPLSPEFLQVKLQAQESVAEAERAELQAMIDYNSALSDLARVAGTILDIHNVKVEGTMGPKPVPVRLPNPPPTPAPAPPGGPIDPTMPPDPVTPGGSSFEPLPPAGSLVQPGKVPAAAGGAFEPMPAPGAPPAQPADTAAPADELFVQPLPADPRSPEPDAALLVPRRSASPAGSLATLRPPPVYIPDLGKPLTPTVAKKPDPTPKVIVRSTPPRQMAVRSAEPIDPTDLLPMPPP